MIEGEDRYARLAARALRGLHESHGRQGSQGSTAVHLEGPPLRDDVRRDAIVAAMALAIAAKARRRRMVTLAVVTLAAAASVVVVLRLTGNGGLLGTKPGAGSALVVEQATGHGIQLVRATTTQPLPVLGVLAVGDGVRSGEDSSAVLGFANGTRITLSSSANLRIDDLGATRHFSLFRGSVQAQVAKLGQGERFVVSTPDSEVEVRGTVFTVTVESSPSRCRGSAGNSIVHVSEGAVWVRSGDKQVVLQPGKPGSRHAQTRATPRKLRSKPQSVRQPWYPARRRHPIDQARTPARTSPPWPGCPAWSRRPPSRGNRRLSQLPRPLPARDRPRPRPSRACPSRTISSPPPWPPNTRGSTTWPYANWTI